MKKIYLVLSYTGTIMSKIVRLYTHYKYSHVSISLDKNISNMYSFGRKNVYNMFDGGFVIENKKSKFYKKFKNTKCIILELTVTKEQYINLKNILEEYKDNIDIYKYDIIGVFLRPFNIKIQRENYYYCTKFVKEVLESSNIYKFDNDFIKPKDFMQIPNKVIYKGKLLNYL